MCGLILNSPFFFFFYCSVLAELTQDKSRLRRRNPLKDLIVSIANVKPERLPRFYFGGVTSPIAFYTSVDFRAQ